MYVPKHFNEDNFDTQTRYIRAASFASLVTSVDGTPYASHLPFYFDPNKGKLGTLYAHVARANGHWKYFDTSNESLTIFTGPNAFITPNWIQSDNAVPTWNYTAVHAYGRPQIVSDTDAVLELLSKLNSANENEITGKWTVDKMDQSVLIGMLKGIVAFEIPVLRIESKRKMSQNKSTDIQKSSIEGLRSMNDPQSTSVADEMESNI